MLKWAQKPSFFGVLKRSLQQFMVLFDSESVIPAECSDFVTISLKENTMSTVGVFGSFESHPCVFCLSPPAVTWRPQETKSRCWEKPCDDPTQRRHETTCKCDNSFSHFHIFTFSHFHIFTFSHFHIHHFRDFVTSSSLRRHFVVTSSSDSPKI